MLRKFSFFPFPVYLLKKQNSKKYMHARDPAPCVIWWEESLLLIIVRRKFPSLRKIQLSWLLALIFLIGKAYHRWLNPHKHCLNTVMCFCAHSERERERDVHFEAFLSFQVRLTCYRNIWCCLVWRACDTCFNTCMGKYNEPG